MAEGEGQVNLLDLFKGTVHPKKKTLLFVRF